MKNCIKSEQELSWILIITFWSRQPIQSGMLIDFSVRWVKHINLQCSFLKKAIKLEHQWPLGVSSPQGPKTRLPGLEEVAHSEVSSRFFFLSTAQQQKKPSGGAHTYMQTGKNWNISDSIQGFPLFSCFLMLFLSLLLWFVFLWESRSYQTGW